VSAVPASAELEARLARFVEHHVRHDERLPIDTLCADRPDLAAALEALVGEYLRLETALEGEMAGGPAGPTSSELPHFEGFQTVERIGGGGMGDVFKLRDLRLDRLVAAKVIRPGPPWDDETRAVLQEARALALFSDRRIVQIYDIRTDADPPAIFMEYVDGFELGRMAPSLDFPHRARLMAEICDAIHHAHTLGLQHRDLKPSNIMLDAQLAPRILDFGLSTGDPSRGHLAGTLPYVAPEQLDPSRPIDVRTDVYGLGAVFYEMLCGRPPYAGRDTDVLAAIRRGRPTLPIEIDARVPEPLQAIALAAMEPEPDRRYASASDMAADIRRFLARLPVTARPSAYAATLDSRAGVHLDQIAEWLRLRLIYPHEAEHLRSTYRQLSAREDEWIVESRSLSYTQIALYLGAFLLVAGSLFYFVADRWHGSVDGLAQPLAVLGLPFVGLNAAAALLYRRDHKAVAVAFYLGAVLLLPLFLLILFYETGILLPTADSPHQLFPDGQVSNRQLQVTAAVSAAWCGWLALRTKTATLSTVFTVLALLLGLAVASDFGLRSWIEDGQWDRVALALLPLVPAYAGLGTFGERTGRPWLSRPSYIGGALLLVVVLELLALDGRALHYIGFTLAPLRPGANDPALLDTIAAMTINGIAFYALAALLHRRSDHLQPAAHLLFTIAPFAMLHPLGYLVRTAEYSPRLDWLYAAFAVVVIGLSQARQRRSFYYAGILNLGVALYLIADHRAWFDRPGWGIAVIVAGLLALGAGFVLDRRARRASR
jgi:serine/threonine protein kinase